MRYLLPVLCLACAGAPSDEGASSAPPPPRPVGPAPARDPAAGFVDISGWAGFDAPLTAPGDGITAMDADRDGDDDLLVPRVGGGLTLYRNQGDGSFGYAERIAGIGSSQAAYAVELTGDGILDVLSVDAGSPTLLRGDGAGGFAVEREILLSGIPGRYSVATFADFTGSGRLAVFLGRMPDGGAEPEPEPGTEDDCGQQSFPSSFDPVPQTLLDASLADMTADAGVTAITRTQAAMTADIDGDGRLDLVLGTEGKHEELVYLGDGKGHFTESAATLGFTEKTSAMGFDLGDIDGDGDAEIVVSDSNPVIRLYVKDGDRWRDEGEERGFDVVSSFSAWGVGLVDFDNDGDLDFFSANSRPEADGCESPIMERLFFLNDGSGHFERWAPDVANGVDELSEARGAAFADFDLDGDVDVAVASADREPQILRNDLQALGHTLFVRLDYPSYSPPVGAVLHVDAGGRRFTRWVVGTPSFGGSNSDWIHVGLGAAESYDSIEIRWPDGTVQTEPGGRGDRRVAFSYRR